MTARKIPDAKTSGTRTHDIVVENTLPHAVDVAWKALTTADLIGQWLMPNDFKPVVGHKFNFRTKPMGAWDGVVDCEVLDVEPGRRLVYSWRGGSAEAALVTTVTWTLRATEAGSICAWSARVSTCRRTTDRDKRRKMVWEIDRRLLEDGARPIIMWNRASTCMQPYVKGYVAQVNSVYNGFRFEDVWLDK